MLGKYSDAIASYDHALQQRSDWREAKANAIWRKHGGSGWSRRMTIPATRAGS
jgi:hypothetical protein